jgi:bifunctional DNA-binding transcriptional regulator/antitoxin component of YhaV-PrlF toxin-antitoxin module
MVTMVTGKNQVTIPARLARDRGIEAGSRIEWLPGSRPDELRLRIQPGRKALLRAVRELGDRCAGRGPSALKTLAKLREQGDADWQARISRLANRTQASG